MAVSLVFFAALAALGALFVARRVLRRIDAMNSSARAIMAGDLTLRLPVSGSGDELDRLAAGLNDMLARIADLMTGLREVSDNIAHDLRTPLTRLRNHAEAALRSADDPAAYRAALETHDRGIGRPDPHLQRAAGDRARRGGRRLRRHRRVRPRRGGRERRRTLRAGRRGERRDVEGRGGARPDGRRQPRADRPGGRQSDRQRGQVRRAARTRRRRRPKSRSSRGATARRWRSRSPTTAPASPPTTARARSNVSCGWKARARGRAPASACRSPPRSMRMHGGALRLDDNEPGLKVTATLPAAAEAARLPAAQAAA